MGAAEEPNQRRRSHPAATVEAAAAVALTLVGGVAGCLSPQAAVRDADDAAYDIIAEKQRAAVGRTEDFTIGELEDQLRRKLMIDQGLPAAGEASFGRPFLRPVPEQPDGVSGGLPLPNGAEISRHRGLRLRGENDLVLNADVGLVDLGEYPDPENVAGVPVDAQRERIVVEAAPPELPPPVVLSLVDALRIGAANSRAFQEAKENVYLAALALDFERDRFEFRFGSFLNADVDADLEGTDQAGYVVSPGLSVDKLFKNGASVTTAIGFDLAKLLTGGRQEAYGFFLDSSVTIPLLAGAGVEVVAEPLQQAERDAIYAIWRFERFKSEFAVGVVSDYFDILVSRDSIANARAALQRRTENVVRAQFRYEVGRESLISLDRVRSNQLDAEARLVRNEQTFEARLDDFKVSLGLPPDARIVLSDDALEQLADEADRILGELAAPSRDGPSVQDLAEPQDSPTVDQRPQTMPTPAAAPGEADVAPPADAVPPVAPPVDYPGEPTTRRLTPSAATREADITGQPAVIDGDVNVDPAELADTDPLDEATAATRPGEADVDRAAREGPSVSGREPAVVEGDFVPATAPSTRPADAALAYAREQQALAKATIQLALRRRLDLAIQYGRVADAQRQTVVDANGLEAVLNVGGGASLGGRRGALSGAGENGSLDFSDGVYGLDLRLNLPIERTAERNNYRRSLIELERAVRDAQASEDGVKLDVLDGLRGLRTAEQAVRIQYESIRVAQRQIEAATMEVELGRGDTRDITDAEDDLIEAQDSFTEALVDYRLSSLELQRDTGVLEVTPDGLYREVDLFGPPAALAAADDAADAAAQNP